MLRLEPTRPDVWLSPFPAEVTVTNPPEAKSIEVRETARIRDEVHLTVGTKEDLDESIVRRAATQLSKLQRFNLGANPELLKANLTNSLHEYEAAMASLERLLLFKHLYTALEIITNIDGTNRDGTALDSQMSTVTGVPQTDCKDWRDLYNRTKYVHRRLADVSTLVSGIENLTRYNSVMRPAAGRELVRILESL